jgi:hypothetical protein
MIRHRPEFFRAFAQNTTIPSRFPAAIYKFPEYFPILGQTRRKGYLVKHPVTTKIIAARSVATGETLYLTACDAWTPEFAIAQVLDHDDHDWRLSFANRLKEVRDPVLVDARENATGLAEPVAA